MKRNVSDDPPSVLRDPGGNEPWRTKEVADIRLQDQRIPIDVVNDASERDTVFEVAALTNPQLDRFVGSSVAHRAIIARRSGTRRPSWRGAVSSIIDPGPRPVMPIWRDRVGRRTRFGRGVRARCSVVVGVPRAWCGRRRHVAQCGRLGHSIGAGATRSPPERPAPAQNKQRVAPTWDGRDPRRRAWRPAIHSFSYGTNAENTLVRSAKSTPPLSTGLGAVEPWVEIQNGSNDAPIEARPS